jgi:uncharacterized lipoprotein YajG
MRSTRFSLMILVCLFVSACSTTSVPLTYDPHKASQVEPSALPVYEVGLVDDQRHEDPRWLGAIRGGFGNPLKKLEAEQPVSKLVKTAFEDGLAARGILAGSRQAKFTFEIVIKKFDCSQYVRRQAHVNVDLRLIRLSDGHTIYRSPVIVDRVSGSSMSLNAGIFGSVSDLRKIMNDALQEAVDKALDTAALRAHLRASE